MAHLYILYTNLHRQQSLVLHHILMCSPNPDRRMVQAELCIHPFTIHSWYCWPGFILSALLGPALPCPAFRAAGSTIYLNIKKLQSQ